MQGDQAIRADITFVGRRRALPANRLTRRRGVFVLLLMFLLVFVQAATLAFTEKAISPYDEGAHFDYVVQVLHGNLPVPAGEHYSDETVQTWACRPTDKAASIATLCGKPRPQSDRGIPFEGVNYNAQFGPIYYLLAAAGAKMLGVLGVGDFTAARLVSALLYALGATLLLLLSRRISISGLGPFGMILAASASGLSLSAGSTITPDSMAVLFTAGAVASALLPQSWRSAVITTIMVGALAGLTKPNFIVVAALAAALLLLRWFTIERRGGAVSIGRILRLGAEVGGPLVACSAFALGWASLSRARGKEGASIDGGVHDVLQSNLGFVPRVAEHISALLRPDGGTVVGPAFSAVDTPVLRAAGLLIVVVALGSSFGACLWRIDADTRAVILLRSVAVALPVSAVLLTAILEIAYQGADQTASRYALPFLAASAVGTGAIVRHRAGPWVAIFGAAVWVAAFVGILHK